MSQGGNLQEAVRGLKDPQFIMLLSNSDQFEAHVKSWRNCILVSPVLDVLG